MRNAFKSTKWLMLLSGILATVVGIVMLFTPLESIHAMAVLIIIALLLSGLAEIVTYFMEPKGFRSAWTLISGILTVFFAVWALFGRGTDALALALPYIFALSFTISAIIRVFGAFYMRKEGFGEWGWALAFSILSAMMGILLLFTPDLSAAVVSYWMGFMLIAYGLDNVILFFRVRRIENEFRKLW